ncbi:MAG TPA: hypothetical protein VIV11_10425 [Kofleriaceae bacterium]
MQEEPDLGTAESEIFVEEFLDSMPNNVPFPNPNGFAASAHAAGFVDLDNAYFTPQGTNGRHCGTCHAPEDGWGLNGSTATVLFVLTDGMHPLFVNNRDTDTPTCDMTTTESRWNCTTMLRQGKFTRSINVPATREYDLTAVSDPFAVSTLTRMWFFRRVLPTASFNTAVINWDGSNNGVDMRDGLERQARGNITGAQQGVVNEVAVDEIVDYEMGIAHAQTYVWGAGSTTAGGAMGGPVNALAALGQPPVEGRFNVFDAWQHSSNPFRRQVYRGQELFNNTNVASGRRCGGCHNSANIGTNTTNAMFNVGASDVRWAKPDMAVFTVQSRLDSTVIVTTDLGRAARTGRMADMNRFDTPNLRGLSARAPYFHNGLAADLAAVVDFYEESLGFNFTDHEEADLVAFLKAL